MESTERLLIAKGDLPNKWNEISTRRRVIILKKLQCQMWALPKEICCSDLSTEKLWALPKEIYPKSRIYNYQYILPTSPNYFFSLLYFFFQKEFDIAKGDLPRLKGKFNQQKPELRIWSSSHLTETVNETKVLRVWTASIFHESRWQLYTLHDIT